MLFAGIGLLDERGQYRENQFLGVRGKKIEYIGAEPPEEDYGEEDHRRPPTGSRINFGELQFGQDYEIT